MKRHDLFLSIDQFVNYVSNECSEFHEDNTVSFKKQYIKDYINDLIIQARQDKAENILKCIESKLPVSHAEVRDGAWMVDQEEIVKEIRKYYGEKESDNSKKISSITAG